MMHLLPMDLVNGHARVLPLRVARPAIARRPVANLPVVRRLGRLHMGTALASHLGDALMTG